MTQQKTILIIGAGLAGLSAAHKLYKAGHKPIVLESADRVGGRVFTNRNFANSQYAEAGGEFIEEFQNHILDLCKEFNFTLDEVRASWTGSDKHFAIFNHRAAFDTDNDFWGCDLQKEIALIWEDIANLAAHVPDPVNPRNDSNAKLDTISVAGWLDSLPRHSLAKLAIAARIRAEFTVEAENYSLLDLARNSALYYSNSNVQSKTFRIRGGNDQLPKALAAVLPDVRLNSKIVTLDVQPDKVIAQTDSGQRIEADFGILAAPLTSARLIQFPTPLPPAHHSMIQELHYGYIVKVLIQYKKRFWYSYNWTGRLMNDSPLAYSWEATGEQSGESGILTIYTGGAAGEALAKMPDSERVAFVIDEINKHFPESKGLVLRSETKAWNNDSHIRGSYLAFHPGDITKHWQALYSPAGRLYFAGEHATPYQGFMDGAVESGQRVAGEIIRQGDKITK